MIKTINQSDLIKQISDINGVDVSVVRSIFKATENIITDHLSSIDNGDICKIHLLRGISIESKYISGICRGILEGSEYERIQVKANTTKNYRNFVNDTSSV